MTLDCLEKGESSRIIGISPECKGEIRQRLLDLGFINGARISILTISPLQDPTAYALHNTIIALRKEDARMIMIEKEKAPIH